jgi:hypothetical protein
MGLQEMRSEGAMGQGERCINAMQIAKVYKSQIRDYGFNDNQMPVFIS